MECPCLYQLQEWPEGKKFLFSLVEAVDSSLMGSTRAVTPGWVNLSVMVRPAQPFAGPCVLTVANGSKGGWVRALRILCTERGSHLTTPLRSLLTCGLVEICNSNLDRKNHCWRRSWPTSLRSHVRQERPGSVFLCVGGCASFFAVPAYCLPWRVNPISEEWPASIWNYRSSLECIKQVHIQFCTGRSKMPRSTWNCCYWRE